MSILPSICIFIVYSFHIGVGMGSLFKIGPDALTKPWWMVDGKPGTGDTPVEILMFIVMGLWYTGSVIAVILAYTAGSTPVLQGALMGHFFYHVTIAISEWMLFEKYKIINTDINSGAGAASIHVFLAIMVAG